MVIDVSVSELEQRVLSVMAKELKRDLSHDEATLALRFSDDLKLDSLDQAELILAMENDFGVSIDDQMLEKLVTVGDAVREVVRLVDKKNSKNEDVTAG